MQTYTWYSTKSDINSPDTIHNILAFGTLKDIDELKRIQGEEMLKSMFLQHPKKIYYPSVLNFISKFILHISQPIDENRYLKTTPRNIG